MSGGNLEKFKQNGYYDYTLIRQVCKTDEEMEKAFHQIAKEKPILVVYANCQGTYITRIMLQTDIIVKKYNIVMLPAIQNLGGGGNKFEGFSAKYMQYISVFIYQHVSPQNKFSPFLATTEVISTLKADVVKCSIPNVYFTGYHPQYDVNKRALIINGVNKCPYADKKIEQLIYSGERGVESLKKIELFTNREVEENVYNSLQELRIREKTCDVIISDYIEKNYRDKRLFYTPQHPTTECLIELVERVYEKLNIIDYHIDKNNLPENDAFECFIYNSVRQKLNLKFNCDKFRFSRFIDKNQDDLQGYVNKYKMFCFPEFNSEVIKNFRTIDISEILKINMDIVNERNPKQMLVSGRQVHLSLYLNLKRTKGVIASFPSIYAPRYSYISTISVIRDGVYPTTIDEKGNIIIGMPEETEGGIAIIDTTWSIR